MGRVLTWAGFWLLVAACAMAFGGMHMGFAVSPEKATVFFVASGALLVTLGLLVCAFPSRRRAAPGRYASAHAPRRAVS